ncbi:hypothetical protein U1Q18_030994, partial [Sarracenia purpurea var. burkii]
MHTRLGVPYTHAMSCTWRTSRRCCRIFDKDGRSGVSLNNFVDVCSLLVVLFVRYPASFIFQVLVSTEGLLSSYGIHAAVCAVVWDLLIWLQSVPIEELDTKKRGVGLSSGKGGESSSLPSLETSAPKVNDLPSLQAVTDSNSANLKITEDEQEGKEAYESDSNDSEEHTDDSSDVSEEVEK